jgi:hypothetical protein
MAALCAVAALLGPREQVLGCFVWNTSWCLVTSYFRHLASAPKERWRARAGAPALGQEPKLSVFTPLGVQVVDSSQEVSIVECV